jgi:peptidase E
MKTKYILHGGFTRKDTELNRSFFIECTKTLTPNAKILLVFFASGDEDKSDVATEIGELFRSCSPEKNFAYVVATKDNFSEQLKTSDLIYFHGGNTPTLLETVGHYPEMISLFSNKIVAGSSAGAYMLAQIGTAHTSEHIREGLGLVPVRLVCHHNSTELPPSPQSLIEITQVRTDLPLVYLEDCAWQVFEM